MPTRVLGISAFYHDSAAALVEDGRVVAAAQEERFTRTKHDASFPKNAIAYCLKAASTSLDAVDFVAFYDKPFLKFERLLETYLAFAPRGFRSFAMAMPLWLKEKLFQKKLLGDELTKFTDRFAGEERLLFGEHHQSHAASAYYPSPFQDAVVLTMDGVGEWATTSVGVGRDNTLELLREIHFPHSIGLLYSAFTYYTGFKVNSGEYKVMGLAPYGKPKYAQLILDNIIDLRDDGSFHLNMEYFDYCTGLRMTNERFAALFGAPVRDPETPLTQFHMDVAASIQEVTEQAVIRLTDTLADEFGARNLCLAGGVALNCVANGKVLGRGKFDEIWVQPAAGDAGGSIGAALATYHDHLEKPRVLTNGHDGMSGAYLGPVFTDDDAADRLRRAGAQFEQLSDDGIVQKTAAALANGAAVGWFQGRMEFGPRALGNRSILADPRDPETQRTLNLKIKYRESFRPFAPSVIEERAGEWFELGNRSPYMLMVAGVRPSRRHNLTSEQQGLSGIDKLNVPRSQIPAVTHVDYSARIQTVHQDTNPRYYALLRAFAERTGCPVLVNTSFNIRGEPIVCTPEDAFRCFMGTELDVLVVGNLYLEKQSQEPGLKRDYRESFGLD